MGKKLILLAVALLFVAGVIFYFGGNKKEMGMDVFRREEKEEIQKIERKASFAIFTNGTFRIFTASMYHNLSEDVYITAESPNTVTVTKEGVTWADFFETLPMELTKECLVTGTGQTFCSNDQQTLKFYVNGQRDDNLLERKIMDEDMVLISFGNGTEEEIAAQMEKIPEPN